MVNRKIAAVKFDAGEVKETVESVAREEALQITINLKPYTITMRTPGQDASVAPDFRRSERLSSARRLRRGSKAFLEKLNHFHR